MDKEDINLPVCQINFSANDYKRLCFHPLLRVGAVNHAVVSKKKCLNSTPGSFDILPMLPLAAKRYVKKSRKGKLEGRFVG